MTMTDDLRARLEEDQRIIDAATDGPWEAEGSLIGSPHYAVGQAFSIRWREDLAMIAASRTRWEKANQALLAVLEVEDEPIFGDTMMGYEIHEAEGANRMLREVRRTIEEAMR